MSTSQEIQTDIEGTRADLSRGLDRLSEKVAPGKVFGRRVDTVKSGAASLRERVMGASDDGGARGGVTDSGAGRFSDLGSAAGSGPQACATVRRVTRWRWV